MGFLDDVAGKVLGGAAGAGQSGDLMSNVLGMIAGGQGGLGGLVQAFQSKGLGDIVGSWVSTGENQPISAEQLEGALGSDTISNLANQAGLPASAVTSQLTQLLPSIVDKLTPAGQVPEGGLSGLGLDALKGLLSK
jgi:uncharacterized protein YidB (DUF937 family)